MHVRAICLLVVAACGKPPSQPTSADAPRPADAAADADHCAGRGCATLSGQLTVTVLDAMTQMPIAVQPTFTTPIYSGPLAFTCSAAVTPCPSWVLGPQAALGYSLELHTSAPGYMPATTTVQFQMPVDCCGAGPDVATTITLSR